MRDAIILSLQTIAADRLNRSPEQCPPDCDFNNVLGGDDLYHLEITMAAEERFGVELEDAIYSEWRTLAELADLLQRPAAERAA